MLSEPVHCRAWEDAARAFGRELPERFGEDGIGKSDGALCRELEALWGGEARAEAILAKKRALYQDRAREETVLVPGAREALLHFSRSYPLAIATSSSIKDIEHTLERYGLAEFFSAVLTIESITEPKPHPEIYLKAADRLSRAPKDCWVFEDSVQGARAARAAGARVIGMTTSLGAEELHPIEADYPDFLGFSEIHRMILDRSR